MKKEGSQRHLLQLQRLLAGLSAISDVMRLADEVESFGSKASSAVQKAATNVREVFEEIDDNILNYCSLDAKVSLPCSTCQLQVTMSLSCDLQGGRPLHKMSLGEKEQEFLGALRVSHLPLSTI